MFVLKENKMEQEKSERVQQVCITLSLPLCFSRVIYVKASAAPVMNKLSPVAVCEVKVLPGHVFQIPEATIT